MIKRLQNAEGEEVKSHEELRIGRDIFIAVDVYRIEFSTPFPAAIQRLAEANMARTLRGLKIRKNHHHRRRLHHHHRRRHHRLKLFT